MNPTTRRVALILFLLLGGFIAGLVVTGSLHWTPESAAIRPVLAKAPPLPRAGITSFADIASAALPSVVTITSTGVVTESPDQMPGGDLFEFFFGPRGRGVPGQPRQRRQVSAGSGFLIADNGLLLTNNHVIAGASRIQVTLKNREVYIARVVGTDPATDVAVIRIDAKGKLPAIPLGDSEKMRVGDPVMAIGNPLNFNGTVTVGVLSAKGRTGISDDPNGAALQDFLQTDAAINFGNSGGPLINMNAEVIGIATAMIQPAQNIGFAVAINTAKAILPQLEKAGKVTRGMLGVRIGPVDQDIMQAFHLPSINGAFVESVDAGAPADRAGVKPGDDIVSVDGQPVNEPRDLINYVSAKPPGQKVQLGLIRSGQKMTVTATLSPRTAEAVPASNPGPQKQGRGEKLGVTVEDLTPEIQQELNVPPGVAGIVVTNVRDDSPAADQGLAPGDIITEANGHKISSISQFRSEMQNIRSGEYLRLYVRRFAPQEISRFVLIRAQ
jgi:serine protease Do